MIDKQLIAHIDQDYPTFSNSHAIAARIGGTVTEVDKTYTHLYPEIAVELAEDLNRHKDGFNFNLIPAIHPLWFSLTFCYQNVIKRLLSTLT